MQTQWQGPRKPANEKGFKKPVRWLLGRQLISSLKWIAMYSAFQDKLDAKDWMRAEVFPFDDGQAKENEKQEKEFWFDYMADTGDGQKATYSIAYLCMSNLWVKDPPAVGCDVGFAKTTDCEMPLPRGAFLFVGGDTAYHIADYKTLAARFKTPFGWAFVDLEGEEKISREPEDQRPIFGIPGNHDYYDALDGFNRQFRKPTTPEGQRNHRNQLPQLFIPGFERCQEASYVALRLPFGWWFWGLDVQEGKLDVRQAEFFRNARGKTEPKESPKKLIVATPEPTTFFGKCQKKESKLSKAFASLRLKRPFLRLKPEEQLAKDECRLDIAGDVHHYARYWKPDTGGVSQKTPSANHYASVVSGLGGAFLHPSHTDMKEIDAQALYPPQCVSRKAVAKRILKPWNVMNGGYVWLVGAIVAAVIYYAGTCPPSTKAFLDSLIDGKLQGIFKSNQAFSDNLKMLASLILAAIALAVSVWYPKKFIKKARESNVEWWHYLPVWVLTILSVAVLCAGVWAFGSQPAKHLFFDLIFALVVITVGIGLPLFAVLVGAKLHGWRGKAGFLVLGSWHALLQLAVPFLIVMSGSWVALGLALLVAFVFIWIGAELAKRKLALLLLVAWLIHGCLQLYLPVRFWDVSPQSFSWLLIGIALGLGAVMSCVWLGWYLAVCLAFNGHNNEAGGAARIERFKQFIRFRLTKEKLTGYVIAVDDPKINGCDLRPKIIDIFHIAPQAAE